MQELLKKKCDLQQRLSFLTTETVESKLLRRVSYAEPIQGAYLGAEVYLYSKLFQKSEKERAHNTWIPCTRYDFLHLVGG